MSKKKNRIFNQSAPARTGMDLTAEYKIIRHDLLRVVILNLIFLAGMLALYYTNQRSQYLEAWFSKILHF